MTGLLSDRDMDMLTGWIGTGPKTFDLLYKISRDGCDATTFHQKCDNQGATVTVLYNLQKTVYGGYTSQSWTSRNTWVNDKKAFLFRLNLNGSFNPIKMPRNGKGDDVYDNSEYGPTYGVGLYGRSGTSPNFGYYHTEKNDYCLHTFDGSIENTGGYFSLNGYMELGDSYDFEGLQVDQINNNNMDVTDLEVYRVKDGERPMKLSEDITDMFWRKVPPVRETLVSQLEEEIVGFRVDRDLKFSQARILLVGPVGAGKSSFCNTINSIFKGKVIQKAISGNAEESLTTQFTQHIIRTRTGNKLNFRICDTRGLEETQGIDTTEYNYLLDGHIPNYYEFNPSKSIKPGKHGFIAEPTRADKIHMIVFVLDASTLDVLPSKIVDKMKNFQTIGREKGLPQVLVLTQIDKICMEAVHDASLIFRSSNVKNAVEKAAQTFGLPRSGVLPMKNYENEMKLDTEISAVALLSMTHILNCIEGYLENILDEIEEEREKRHQLGEVPNVMA